MEQNKNKLSFRTVVVVVLAVIALSASLSGISGRCFIKKNGNEIEYVECNCRCEQYGRDSKGRCVECNHYVDVEPIKVETSN